MFALALLAGMNMLERISDYPAHLERCWQEHLLPREENAPTVISTFAGGGGSSLGYSMAGFSELLAVEWDDNAVETFKLNFDVPVYHGDIKELMTEKVLEMTGLEVGELDILDGSPPCQGFSTAGKRQLSDRRNDLYLEFSRLLRGLQPKVFVMENVSGMVKGKMKLVFAEILKDLKSAGYNVSVRLLNAMYFGVPQSRQRLIFIGVRNDLGIVPSHPKAETKVISSLRYLPGEFKGLKFLNWRNRGKNDTLSDICPAITKTGITIEGRRVLRDAKVVQMFQSFPKEFSFYGNEKSGLSVFANSVPPLMMRSIALHIRREILDRL